MDVEALIAGLRAFPAELTAVVSAATDERLVFRPSPEAWSITGVLHHLADEEEADFRVRLRSTLEDSDAPWPGIDPEAWAVERDYEAGDPLAALARFCRERSISIAWLEGLGDLPRERWATAHAHPRLGVLRAEELLAAWALHDRLHLAQIIRRSAEHVEALAGDVSCRYAKP